MKTFDELNVTNSTIFEWEGKELRTVQDPYPSAFDNGEVYTAFAVDENNNEYRAYWEVINSDTADESEVCDWDSPLEVVKL